MFIVYIFCKKIFYAADFITFRIIISNAVFIIVLLLFLKSHKYKVHAALH